MNNKFEMVSQVLHLIAEDPRTKWSLADLARQFGISEHHLQKTFRSLAGVSPKQFQKFLDKELAIMNLKSGQTVLDTALDLGLSGPGRLHDLLVTTEAVTPGQAKTLGQGLEMSFGSGPTPFGPALIAWTRRGVSFLGFARQNGMEAVHAELARQWPCAVLLEDRTGARDRLNRIFALAPGETIKVWLRGSPFQLKVWEALLRIPASSHVSYGQIAKQIGQPLAGRAVGSAIGRNPVAWLIPCHRVITSLGKPGGYRWGVQTKMIMNAWESGQVRGAA